MIVSNQVVKLIVSNQKIWNQTDAIFEIISASKKGPVIIDLNTEAPDCQAIGIDKILDCVREIFELPIEHFTIRTGNYLKTSKYKEVVVNLPELRIAKTQTATRSNLTKVFGLFIGRSNSNRLALASYMFKNYNHKTELTFHFDHDNEYHKTQFGIEDLLLDRWYMKDIVCDFLDNTPLGDKRSEYPIDFARGAFDLHQQYANIFCDIVCETFTDGKTFLITEKTLRAISSQRPFVVYGPRYFLHNLKLLGFKTFDTWWAEGYDIDHDGGRLSSVMSCIDWIAQQPEVDIIRWYEEMQPTLEHNALVLKTLTDSKLQATDYFYE